MSELFDIHKLKITTLGPLSIGTDDGKTLSPYSDFVPDYQEGYVRYVNHKMVEEKLKGNLSLLDEYVNGIRDSMDNNKANFDLRTFIEDKLKINISDFPKVKTTGISSDTRQEIRSLIREAGKPFLPASSFKGAIRTAMLYDWLREKPEIMEQWLEDFRTLHQLRKNFKDNKFKIDDIEKQLFNEDKLFGRLGDKNKAPLTQHIIVRDSNFLPKEQFEISAAKRIRLKLSKKDDDGEIPTPREVLPTNTEFFIDIHIRKHQLKNTFLSYWHDSTVDVLAVLKRFGRASLIFESDEMKQALLSKPKLPSQSIIQSLKDRYDDMIDQIDNEDACFMRIGAGKTYYDNSLALSFFDFGVGEDSKWAFGVYQDYAVKKFNIQNAFPVTRTVSALGEPFGWVKIEQLQ